MFPIFSLFLSVFLVLVLVYFIWKMFSLHQVFSNFLEKKSPFECGFTPKEKARLPFSLRFFLLIILFLIFDIELTILLQLPFEIFQSFFSNLVSYMGVGLILLLGLLEEWRRGILNWNK